MPIFLKLALALLAIAASLQLAAAPPQRDSKSVRVLEPEWKHRAAGRRNDNDA